MTRAEHLLWILAEECAEVAQRASKAARFGLYEVQPGQGETNRERLAGECSHLVAAIEMLVREDCIDKPDFGRIQAKIEKVERFFRYSVELGTLEPPALPADPKASEQP